MADSVRLLIRALAVVLLWASMVWAQNLTSSEETITVAASAIGVTADLCGSSNTGGAWVQVIAGAIYFSLHSSTATPDSGDFALSIGGGGPQFWVKPASKLRMIQQTASSTVKVQCTD